MVDAAEIRSNGRGLAKLAGGQDEARRRLVGDLESTSQRSGLWMGDAGTYRVPAATGLVGAAVA